MQAFIPELISTDILLRLPVKSLLRFRCLSTSFCAEIDSADFVKNHLNRSIQDKTRLKLIIADEFNSTSFYAADFNGGLKEAILLNNPFKTSPLDDTPVCNNSCNGLILFVIYFNRMGLESIKLALWNPFTRRYKSIPPGPVELASKVSCAFGLGHDSAVDDYKIVKIVRNEYHYTDFEVWIFSLKSNSWRRSKDLHLGEDTIRSCVCRFANGALYWECKGKILGFDIANELFFNLPLVSNGGGNANLGPYNNAIALLEDNLYISKIAPTYKTIEFYLSVNGKGGVKAEAVAGGSWRKAFAIEDEGLDTKFKDIDILPWPFAYSKHGDSILLRTVNEMFWYNLGKKTAQKVEIAGMHQSESFGFDVCWESLVSLGNESAFDDGAAEDIDPMAQLVE